MSRGKRRVFSREFKLSAVKRALSGESVAALSRELGVPRGQVYKWGRHYRAGGARRCGRLAGRAKASGSLMLRPPTTLRRRVSA